MEAMVASGKGKMTPFAGKLTPAEIKDVVAYVKGGLK
jgi:mono/diheme cytochrome c family protein